jgi:hypothetical protein
VNCVLAAGVSEPVTIITSVCTTRRLVNVQMRFWYCRFGWAADGVVAGAKKPGPVVKVR